MINEFVLSYEFTQQMDTLSIKMCFYQRQFTDVTLLRQILEQMNCGFWLQAAVLYTQLLQLVWNLPVRKFQDRVCRLESKLVPSISYRFEILEELQCVDDAGKLLIANTTIVKQYPVDKILKELGRVLESLGMHR